MDSIKNGIITHATLKEGGEVEITCRTNFTLVGSAKITCIKGKWSDNLPSCKGLQDNNRMQFDKKFLNFNWLVPSNLFVIGLLQHFRFFR